MVSDVGQEIEAGGPWIDGEEDKKSKLSVSGLGGEGGARSGADDAPFWCGVRADAD